MGKLIKLLQDDKFAFKTNYIVELEEKLKETTP